MGSPRVDGARDRPAVSATTVPRPHRRDHMSRLLMVAIAVLLLAGAAAVGLYIGGVLK